MPDTLAAPSSTPSHGSGPVGPFEAAELLALLPEAVLLIDREWRIAYANERAMHLSRLTQADLGRNHWELYPETLGTDIETTYRRVMSTRTGERFEFFYPPFEIWLDLRIVPTSNGGLLFYYRDTTSQHAAETRRDRTAQQLEQVYAASPDAILILDREWKLHYANQQCINLLHSGPLVGRDFFEFFPGNYDEPYFSNYNRTMTERVATEFEAYYGEPLYMWFRVLARPFDGSSLLIFLSDISDRKQAEIARDQVLDVTNDGVAALDRNWRYTYMNRRGRELAAPRGYDLIGKVLWDAFPGALGTPIEENYRRTMNERVPTSLQTYYPEPFNLWLDLDVRPSGDGIVVFFHDVTARKLAEQERDRTLDQLHQVFESTADAVLSLDRNYTFTFLNRRAEELLAPASADLLGANLRVIFPDALEEDSPHADIYHRAMEEGIPGQFESYFPSPLNLWLEIQARPSEDGIVVFFRDVTARRESEQALREQQALLTAIQQAAGVATYEFDLRTGRITYGPGSAPVFGRPLAELDTAEQMRAAMHPDSHGLFDRLLVEAERGSGATIGEYRMAPPDNRVLWIEGRSQVVRRDGVPILLRGLAVDITKRKRNEEAMIASETRYRVLADLNPQALWIGDPQGRITYANQGFLDYLGLTEARLDDWLGSFNPADQARVLEAWTHSVRTGEEYEIEARLIRAHDGESRWWHLRALPVRDEAGGGDRARNSSSRAPGKIVQWLGVANDIHDLRTAAETLRQQQRQTERERAELEAVYQTAPIGLALFDPVEFRYLRLNHRQAAFFGLPPAEIAGKTVTQMAPIPGLREIFEQVAGGKPVINHLLEGELTTHPGEHRFWNVNYFPVYGPDGAIQAISAASMEITQQKKAEAALIQSEKLAAVGRLASSISHEINNPLEAITNLLYLVVMDARLPGDLRTYVRLAQSELARVSQIATQTLRFHRQAVRPTEVTAAQLVDAVLNLYQGRLVNSGIDVDAQYASQVPILCYENDIRQVLNNLIANAIDAMRSGGRLLVRAHDTSMPEGGTASGRTAGHPAVRITVADTGHGMSPETRARVFEPFFTTKDLNGTGLGLWISAGIVDRHHGRMLVRSSQDPDRHGTVFSLILPVQDAPEPSTAETAEGS